MKPSKLTLLPLAAAVFCMSSTVLAQNTELDMTMTIMEEGQEPAGFIRKIQLPSPEAAARDNASAADAGDNAIADQVKAESSELIDEASSTVTDSIKDILSIDGASGLPGDIVDNLSDDLPLLDTMNNLAGDPPIDLPQDMTQQQVDDAINTVDDPLDEINDVDSEIDKTLEETKSLLP